MRSTGTRWQMLSADAGNLAGQCECQSVFRRGPVPQWETTQSQPLNHYLGCLQHQFSGASCPHRRRAFHPVEAFRRGNANLRADTFQLQRFVQFFIQQLRDGVPAGKRCSLVSVASSEVQNISVIPASIDRYGHRRPQSQRLEPSPVHWSSSSAFRNSVGKYAMRPCVLLAG